MKKIILSGAALAALLATPAMAQRAEAGAAEPVSRQLVETRVRERFQRMDSNRDGFLTQEEVQAFRASTRAERRQKHGNGRAAMFERLDANRDGMISREEFDQRRLRRERGERRDVPGGFGARVFSRIDTDGDRRISLAEATQARLRMFERVDTDRDGRISPEERRARRAARGRS